MKTNKEMSLRTHLTLRALIVREKIRAHLKDCNGTNQHTDNGGLTAAGIVVTVVVISLAVPFTRDVFWAKAADLLLGLFNYSN